MKRLQHLFLFLLLSFTSRAAGIKIIESTASLQGDVHWQTVVTAMGHVGLIVPVNELDDINNFNTTDAIIVSDGTTNYSATQIATLKAFLLSGRPVYLQTEYDKNFSANQAFAQFVTAMGGSFTWGATKGPDLGPSTSIQGTFATTDNAVTSLPYFWFGCIGSGSGVFPFIKSGNDEVGWSFCPTNPGYGKLITVTDQDWAGVGYSSGDEPALLMLNIIKHLLTPLCGGTNISGSIVAQTNVSCKGGTNGSVTVAGAGGTAPYSYSWQPTGSTSASLTNLAAGVYTCTITDALSVATTVTATITEPATALTAVTAQTDVSCNGGANGTASVVASGGTAPYTYAWAPAGGLGPTALGLTAGTYTVTVKDTKGCITTESVTITQSTSIQFTTITPPEANYGEAYSANVAASGGTGNLSYSLLSGALPPGLVLSVSTGAISGTPTNTGNYVITVKATDANNCFATKTYNLLVKKAEVIITANPQTKAYGDTDPALTYTVTGLVYGEVLTGSLSRAAGENVGVYAILQNTLTASNNYNVTYTGNNLTINKRAITITANAQTKTYADTDPSLTYTVTGLVNGDILTGSLNRSPGENAGTYPINQNTLAAGNNYDITYTGNTLTISKAVLTARADDKVICLGSNLPVFTIQYSGFKNGDNVSAIATVPVVSIINPSTAGTYPLLPAGGAANNYQFNYVSGLLTVHPSPSTPVITVLDNKTALCEGEQATLTAAAANASSYTWSTGANGSSITVGTAGNYTVTAKSAEACVSLTSPVVTITLHSLPAGSITQTATGPGVLAGYTLAAPAGASYSWNTGETAASIIARSSGSYRVTVTNQQGCSKEFLTQVAFSIISIPNTFSPNGDGVNDYWMIPELKNYSPVYVTIVNRDGQTVFESKNFTRWDGRYKGNDLPAGVYFYRMRAGGSKTMEGWLNLVR